MPTGPSLGNDSTTAYAKSHSDTIISWTRNAASPRVPQAPSQEVVKQAQWEATEGVEFLWRKLVPGTKVKFESGTD